MGGEAFKGRLASCVIVIIQLKTTLYCSKLLSCMCWNIKSLNLNVCVLLCVPE